MRHASSYYYTQQERSNGRGQKHASATTAKLTCDGYVVHACSITRAVAKASPYCLLVPTSGSPKVKLNRRAHQIHISKGKRGPPKSTDQECTSILQLFCGGGLVVDRPCQRIALGVRRCHCHVLWRRVNPHHLCPKPRQRLFRGADKEGGAQRQTRRRGNRNVARASSSRRVK